MSTHRRVVLLSSFTTLTGVFALLLTLQIADGHLAIADLSSQPKIESKKHIPNCKEAGVCKKGEQGFILNTVDAIEISNVRKKGCKVVHQLKDTAVLRCPDTVVLSNATVERVFRVSDMYANQQIGAAAVQQSGLTGNGVRVAILDTGVDTSHQELQGRVALTQNFTSDDSTDVVGHGTHVAGIIAGQGVQNFSDRNRALGVAPGAELIVAKVCNSQGWCSEGDIVAGIQWAVAQKARVINMSLGGGAFLAHCDDDSLAAQANWAARQGVVVVAAAGNSGESTEGIATPGCGSQVIAVGAVDSSDARASWSNYGVPLDVMAPGVGILSSVSCLSAGTCPTSAYGWWSGTSMATPNVAGVAALLLQKNASQTPSQIRSLFTSTATDLGTSGFDKLNGYGRVNALAALAAVPESSSSSSSRMSSSVRTSSAATSQSSRFSSSMSSSSQRSAATSSWSFSSSTPPHSEDSHEDENNDNQEDDHDKDHENGFWHFPWPFLRPLPKQAAPPAQEHRLAAPSRGSPRW